MKFLKFLIREDQPPERGTAINVVCPYCGVLLNKEPKRKVKCPHCSEFIYVRSTQKLFPSKLLTKEQADGVDEFYSFLQVAQELGYSERDYTAKNDELSAKFKTKANYRDTVWGLYNDLIMKTKDTGRLGGIYYSMALFANREGRDHEHILLQDKKLRLMQMKQQGLKNVEILANQGCENCMKQNGTVMTIEEAISSDPLPCKSCTHVLYESKKPFCRCTYLPGKIDLESLG